MNKILFSILMSFHFILMGETAQAAVRPVPAPRPYHSLYKHLYEGKANHDLTEIIIRGGFSEASLRELDNLSKLLKAKMPNQKIDWKTELKNLDFPNPTRLFLTMFAYRLIEALPATQQTARLFPSVHIIIKSLKDIDLTTSRGRSMVKEINDIGDAYRTLLLTSPRKHGKDLLASFLDFNSLIAFYITKDLDKTLLILRWLATEGGPFDDVETRLALCGTLHEHGPQKTGELLKNLNKLLKDCRFAERGIPISPLELIEILSNSYTAQYGHVSVRGLAILDQESFNGKTLEEVFTRATTIINEEISEEYKLCQKEYKDSESLKGCLFGVIVNSLKIAINR